MNHPLRENLEIYRDDAGVWTRCTRCRHVLCGAGGDWKQACKRKIMLPTKAGPLMTDLVGQFVLEQMYCPACGALMNSEIVEERKS